MHRRLDSCTPPGFSGGYQSARNSTQGSPSRFQQEQDFRSEMLPKIRHRNQAPGPQFGSYPHRHNSPRFVQQSPRFSVNRNFRPDHSNYSPANRSLGYMPRTPYSDPRNFQPRSYSPRYSNDWSHPPRFHNMKVEKNKIIIISFHTLSTICQFTANIFLHFHLSGDIYVCRIFVRSFLFTHISFVACRQRLQSWRSE